MDTKSKISIIHKFRENVAHTQENTWLGIMAAKNPADAWIYQEIICQKKPDIIIETGSSAGGGALFLASICELINHGEVISVEIKSIPSFTHSRITWVHGSSTDLTVFGSIESRCRGKSVMCVLDSNHSTRHVKRELDLYSRVITTGQYLVVEDTINEFPLIAVKMFLKENSNFEIDSTKERIFFTNNVDGFLLKK